MAYMARARLRRGIRIVLLANRIEELKMQKDGAEDSGLPLTTKGAIFIAVVWAKMQELKEQEIFMPVQKAAREKAAKGKSSVLLSSILRIPCFLASYKMTC